MPGKMRIAKKTTNCYSKKEKIADVPREKGRPEGSIWG